MKIITCPGTPDESSFELKPAATTIGRTKENDVFVLHKSLSRQHARLEHDGDAHVLVDSGQQERQPRQRRPRHGAARSRRATPSAAATSSSSSRRATGLVRASGRPTGRDVDRVARHRRLAPAGMEELAGPPRCTTRLRRAPQGGPAAVGKPHSVDALLGDVLDLVLRIMDVDRAAVLLVDEAIGRARAARAAGRARRRARALLQRAHRALGARQRRRRALRRRRGRRARRARPRRSSPQSICSSMCAPLKAKDRLLGVLYVDNLSTPDRFTRRGPRLPRRVREPGRRRHRELRRSGGASRRRPSLRSTLTRFFPPATIQRLARARRGSLGVIDDGGHGALRRHQRLHRHVLDACRRAQIVDMLNEYFPADGRRRLPPRRHAGEVHRRRARWRCGARPSRARDDVDRAMQAAVDMQREARAVTSDGAAQRPPAHPHPHRHQHGAGRRRATSARIATCSTRPSATRPTWPAGRAAPRGPGQIVITEATRGACARRRGRSGAPAVSAKGVASRCSSTPSRGSELRSRGTRRGQRLRVEPVLAGDRDLPASTNLKSPGARRPRRRGRRARSCCRARAPVDPRQRRVDVEGLRPSRRSRRACSGPRGRVLGST